MLSRFMYFRKNQETYTELRFAVSISQSLDCSVFQMVPQHQASIALVASISTEPM